MRLSMALAGGMAGLAAWLYFRDDGAQQGAAFEPVSLAEEGGLFGVVGDYLGEIVGTNSGFSVAKIPAQYAAAIIGAESAHGIPRNLLARLLYQESRWRQEIIRGAVKSPRGAIGIAQFLPATAKEFGVNPYDAFSSIDGAARYLERLHKSFPTWTEVLAAYNWGQGNLRKYGIAKAPLETRNYYAQILADVGGGVA